MERQQRLELIDHAIQKLIQDNDKNKVHNLNLNDHDAEYQLALSHLLSASQLELLKGDGTHEQSEACSSSEPVEKENVEECKGSEKDEIMKELKNVKRQNFVTHCLLSVMIVLTVTWQLQEVSLLLKFKDGLSHPFRSFGNMLKGMVKVPNVNGQDHDNKENSPESPTLPYLMPHVDVPSLDLQNGKE